MTTPPPDGSRDADLRLARLHVRLGSLGIARAELEAMAGAGELDDESLVDLAEVRWRTGDLSGAGQAATVALEAGSEAPVAYVIAAEATAAAGRPGDARRLASRALELSDMSIGGIFAGMPRASLWPDEPSERMASTVPMFEPPVRPGAPSAANRSIRAGNVPSAPGLWDETDDAAMAMPDADAALESGRRALAAGDTPVAALHLAVALRIAPAVAPTVLELLETVDGPELTLVRGDAFRLVGHERDAQIAFASAASEAAALDEPTDKETT